MFQFFPFTLRYFVFVWECVVHPLIQVPNQLVGAPLGTDVTLICNVEASPKAINYWQREIGECCIGKCVNLNIFHVDKIDCTTLKRTVFLY